MEDKKISQQQGFTLVEVLLYVAIMAAVLASVAVIFSIIIRSQAKHKSISTVEQQGLYGMQVMTQAVRNAFAVNGPTAAGVASSSLSLLMATSTGNPTLFTLSSSTLFVTRGTDSPVALTDNTVSISNLEFYNYSTSTGGSIRISFDMERRSAGDQAELTYTEHFYGTASIRD